jgi:hypothetical protein
LCFHISFANVKSHNKKDREFNFTAFFDLSNPAFESLSFDRHRTQTGNVTTDKVDLYQ